MAEKNDFSFMKAGFNLVQENVEEEEIKKNIATMVILFSKYALKSAALYVSHSKTFFDELNLEGTIEVIVNVQPEGAGKIMVNNVPLIQVQKNYYKFLHKELCL